MALASRFMETAGIEPAQRSPRTFSFSVLGRPQPAGSKRAFVHRHTGRVIVTEDAKRSKPWQQQVGETALAHRDLLPGGLLLGPLELDVTFVLARPKGHYRTGRHCDLVRDGAPAWPMVKPDVTKLVRGVEDALTGVVWRDDAQVVVQRACKVYGVPERAEITVREKVS